MNLQNDYLVVSRYIIYCILQVFVFVAKGTRVCFFLPRQDVLPRRTSR